MRLIAAIALAGLLTSCATVEGVRANGPARTYASAKSPEAVRDCLMGISHYNVSIPIANGWQVSNQFAPAIAQIADIERVGEGSSVKIYTGAGARMLIFMVEGCV
jgi:hypothetical protein